jgi:hypothetical protein
MAPKTTYFNGLLAHAWHDTQPHSNIRTNGPTDAGSEAEADLLATAWGYDMVSLQQWRDTFQNDIAIFTGHAPRPIPAFDLSELDQT